MFYPPAPVNAIPAGLGSGRADAGAVARLLGDAPIVAVRLADLVSPARGPLAEGDRTAAVVAGTQKIGSGDQLVFMKIVAVAPAVVRRDGKVPAGGHPADHARLTTPG